MDTSSQVDILSNNLTRLEEHIQSACKRVGRVRGDVTLVGITKYVSSEVAAELHRLGLTDLGESRPQELWKKAKALPATVNWHLVGHLQTNKIDKTLPVAHMIHSVDSLRLLQALEKEAHKQGKEIDVFLEVNASGEAQKHGFPPEEMVTLPTRLPELERVRICGLMTMAAFEDDPEQCRPTFRLLRELRDQLQNQFPAPHNLQHLSMGMSHDFTVAIEEGATLIRVGSLLFEGLI